MYGSEPKVAQEDMAAYQSFSGEGKLELLSTFVQSLDKILQVTNNELRHDPKNTSDQHGKDLSGIGA